MQCMQYIEECTITGTYAVMFYHYLHFACNAKMSVINHLMVTLIITFSLTSCLVITSGLLRLVALFEMHFSLLLYTILAQPFCIVCFRLTTISIEGTRWNY